MPTSCPHFAQEPKLALLQAPQDHRDGHASLLKSFLNSEYSGFFDIGMVQRNEDDAIVAHGTMLLLRRSAFEAVGGWQTDTITEDTELGLRLLEAGWSSQYTNRRYGHGLLPDNYMAFKTQRHRWAYGATQIIRKHWREMLPGASKLRREQKRQFVLGWSYWFADAMGVLAAIMNLLCVPLIFTDKVMIPTIPFTLPILVAFGANFLHCAILYLARVKLPARQIVGAALAASSLQWTVAVAVVRGFVKDNLPFLRTEKGGIGGPARKNPVIAESILGVLLLSGAALLYATNTTKASVMTTLRDHAPDPEHPLRRSDRDVRDRRPRRSAFPAARPVPALAHRQAPRRSPRPAARGAIEPSLRATAGSAAIQPTWIATALRASR